MILSNCTKTRTFSRYVYGDCILSLWRKSHFQRLEHKCFFAIITMIFGLFLKNGHASQTFFRRPLKKIFSGQHKKSGSTICSSYAAHPMASAFRADTDICFPDHFYQFCHRQTGISGAKALIPLNSEDQFQVFAFAPVIQESIVTDLLETSRKYMHQVSAYEFSIVQCNAPAWFTRFPATCGKSHFFVSDVYNPAVGNSNFMCVSAKILNSIAKSVESLFNIRTPVFVVKTVSEFRLFVGVTEFFTGRGKYHLLLFIKGIQFSEIFSLEFIPEDFDRNEKRTFTFSYLLVCSQSTARNDTVHMYMVFHLLIPCMQDLYDTGCCAEPLFIGRKFQKCLGTASVQERIEELLVTVDQRV